MVFRRIALFMVGLSMLFGLAPKALAASSSVTSVSPLAGNGHNVSFDGRIFVVRRSDGGAHGWYVMVFRPEEVTYSAGGKVNLNQGAFSSPVMIQNTAMGENAVALCEEDADATPYPCNDAGDATGAGPYHCYEFRVFHSNAEEGGDKVMKRRHLKLWISDLEGPSATLHKHAWLGGVQTMTGFGGQALLGIEPTVTRDGKLLVWQGHPNNDGAIDVMIYATSDSACGVSWDGPHSLSHMHKDPKTVGVYPLAEKQLRAADGDLFQDGALIRGAYAWLFPEGDALTFTATNMPCISPENPPGCGPRRNALSVIGYPTNWAVAHIDGAINPSTTDQVRLFFSSPGPALSSKLPLTSGVDVWPLLGTNTANFADVVFDDGLDGQYAGVWLMNESVNLAGDLDKSRTPDTGGYFNRAIVHGATFPSHNNGLFGKALVFDGQNDWLEVAHNATLNPINGLTVELWMRPESSVNCDGNNNWRYLLGKGGFEDGAYSLVFEQGEKFQARVLVGGQMRSVWSGASAQVGQWNHVGFTYSASSGELAFWINGEKTASNQGSSGTMSGSPHPLLIGGPGGDRGSCPNENGVFHGAIDEVRISRVVRDLSVSARPGNHARFVTQSVPTQVSAGASFEASLSFRNVGTSAWSHDHMHRVGSQSPTDSTTWGTGRVDFGDIIHTGQSLTATATFTAPIAAGTYPFQWRMVHEGAEWFGESSELVQITVIGGCGGACDDGDACTTDTCDLGTNTCVFEPGVACDDGDACTTDTCNPQSGACEYAEQGGCEDFNACTADACDPSTGQCVHTPLVACDDDNACTADTCNPNTGGCVYTLVVDCDDDQACTSDVCDAATGLCVHDTSACVCTEASECDDMNPCTQDACQTVSGETMCVHLFEPEGACDDGDPCTEGACDPELMACVYAALCEEEPPDDVSDAGAHGADADEASAPDGELGPDLDEEDSGSAEASEDAAPGPGSEPREQGDAGSASGETSTGARDEDSGEGQGETAWQIPTRPGPDPEPDPEPPAERPFTGGTSGGTLGGGATPPMSEESEGCASGGGAAPLWMLIGTMLCVVTRRRA